MPLGSKHGSARCSFQRTNALRTLSSVSPLSMHSPRSGNQHASLLTPHCAHLFGSDCAVGPWQQARGLLRAQRPPPGHTGGEAQPSALNASHAQDERVRQYEHTCVLCLKYVGVEHSSFLPGEHACVGPMNSPSNSRRRWDVHSPLTETAKSRAHIKSIDTTEA